MKLIDLHVHSNRSDGTLSPSSVVEAAASAGLSAFALTDHDTMEGIPEALLAGAAYGIEVIPGIEFSTEYRGTDIHIVGLELDHQDDELMKHVQHYREERVRRNEKMIRRMAKDGIDISVQQMTREYGDGVWTRAHFARYLTEHGYTADRKEAFRTMIGDGCRYFIPRVKVSPMEVTALIRKHHGIPVLAHPFQYRFSDSELRTLVSQLKAAGLTGMEVYYSFYTKEQQDSLLSLTREFDLAPGGGSDFHGANKPEIQIGSGSGSLQIPYAILEQLRQHGRERSSL